MSVNNNPNNPLNPKIQNLNTTPAANPDDHTQQIKVSRELDGVNDTGIIGELLTVGTEHLSEANKYFAMAKFSVSGLLAEDNQAVPASTVLFKNQTTTTDPYGNGTGQVLCADDMYVAGDPGVGGKGNNYQYNEIAVEPGYYLMFEDGQADGPGIIINAHVDSINPEGNRAFTEYGFVIRDEQGLKTQAVLSGGQLIITDANGQSRKLLPPNDVYYVGNPMDPTAKFYYADVPGAGENGQPEKRLMVEYYEKAGQDTINRLVAEGADPQEAAQLRSTSTFSYGFRVPDGANTYALPEGVGAGAALKVGANGVKTYYDSHYGEGECSVLNICPSPPPPPPDYPPPPEYPPPPVAENEHARIWGDPHIEEADGGKYDFNGVGIYSILKDKGVALNAQMVAGPGSVSVNDEAGLTLGNRTVHVLADGTVTIGFADPNNQTPATTLQDGQSLTLDNGTISRSGPNITVETPEYKIRFETGRTWKNMNYLNIDVWSRAGGVFSDGVAPTGLLGESFDADDDRQRAPKLNAEAYRQDSLLEQVATDISQPPPPAPQAPSWAGLQEILQDFSPDTSYSAPELQQAAGSDAVKNTDYAALLNALATQAQTFNRPVTAADLQKLAQGAGPPSVERINQLPTVLGWQPATPTPPPATDQPQTPPQQPPPVQPPPVTGMEQFLAMFQSLLQQMMAFFMQLLKPPGRR